MCFPRLNVKRLPDALAAAAEISEFYGHEIASFLVILADENYMQIKLVFWR